MRYEELISMLKNTKDVNLIDSQRNDIAQFIPGIEIMFGYNQKHRAHQYDLWMHSCHTVAGLPRNLDDDMLYLAGLLHDVGKPYTFSNNYINHARTSMILVRDKFIPEMKLSGAFLLDEDIERLLYYVRFHDDCVNLGENYLKSHLSKVSLVEFKNLMLLQMADAKAHIQFPAIERRFLLCRRLLRELNLLGEKGV